MQKREIKWSEKNPGEISDRKSSEEFVELLKVMKTLRGKNGCPWDKKQTRESIKWYLIEEGYEVLDALEKREPSLIREELGDLLFQIIFFSRISEELGEFDIFDVIRTVRKKMIQRHPHVFGEKVAEGIRDVKKIWQEIKQNEKESKNTGLKKDSGSSIFDSTPKNLPSLLRAYRLTKKAADAGFDWNKVEDVFAKLEEEIGELKESIELHNKNKIEDELGDLLFSTVNIARFLQLNPEDALRKANDKFTSRFAEMERAMRAKGESLGKLSVHEMDRFWEEAKKREQ